MRTVKTLGLLGTGLIGGGWAARALHYGINVIAADVKPEMEEYFLGVVSNAEPALSRLTLAPLPQKGKLTFTTNTHAMAAQCDFIQENIPEQIELKQRVLADISRTAPGDVIIASSTSGLMPTELQRDIVAPERLLVGHPFNPVYLLPLVELVGGDKTSIDTIEGARRFYTYIGMHALHVRREVPGHLTDRLQEALWREILHLINDGVATTDELDQAIIYGPGLRWAAMGTNLIYHLAGGEPGMRHMLAQFGPSLKWPWTKLEAPELSEQLIDRLVEGTQAQAGGRSIRELERLRDDYLVAIQQVLRQYDIGAGATLKAVETRLHAEAAAKAPAERPDRLLRLVEMTVRPQWVDHNGYLSDSRYSTLFADATDALFRKVGIDDTYRASGRMYYPLETHVTHIAHLKADEPFYVTTQIIDVDETRLHLFHTLYRSRDDESVSSGEQMYVHFSTTDPKASSVDPAVQVKLADLQAAHASQPRPTHISIGMSERRETVHTCQR